MEKELSNKANNYFPTIQGIFPRAATLMPLTHMPRTGELSMSKGPCFCLMARSHRAEGPGGRGPRGQIWLVTGRSLKAIWGGRGGRKRWRPSQTPRRSPSEIAQRLLSKQAAFTPPDEIEGVKGVFGPESGSNRCRTD